MAKLNINLSQSVSNIDPNHAKMSLATSATSRFQCYKDSPINASVSKTKLMSYGEKSSDFER